MTYCWCFYDRNGYVQGICTFCSRNSFFIPLFMNYLILLASLACVHYEVLGVTWGACAQRERLMEV